MAHAVAELNFEEHQPVCVGAGGRVRINGQWVERPRLEDGREVSGLLGAVDLPRWWVWR